MVKGNLGFSIGKSENSGLFRSYCGGGGGGGGAVTKWTLELEVKGSNPTTAVLEQDTLSSPEYW